MQTLIKCCSGAQRGRFDSARRVRRSLLPHKPGELLRAAHTWLASACCAWRLTGISLRHAPYNCFSMDIHTMR